MIEKKVEIGGSLYFESVVYEHGDKSASFEFIERSTAYGFSDTHTSIDIERETAEKLVAALREHFGF